MADTISIVSPDTPGPVGKIRLWWGAHPYGQLLLIAALALVLGLLCHNILASMHRLGMAPGLDYLWQPANFDITESLLVYQAGDSYARAIAVGLLNTLKLAVLGCLFATILGTTLGIARLSGNLLLSRLVQAYVELIRNTPLPLQLFFWIALTQALPPTRQALQPFSSTFLSVRGIFLPWVEIGNGQSLWLLAAVLVLLAFAARAFIRRLQHPLSALGFLGLLALFPAIALAWIFVAGITFTPDLPVLQGFNIRGGITLTPEFAAMLVGLTIYYSASISESVRSGIESVNVGQWEAGRAIGLPRGRIMRLIVMPQAMRVITPLMTSSYLDLTKDTTLGILIGFTEVTAIIKTSANNTGNAVETIIVLVAVFLAVSMPTSYLINLYNRSLAKRGIIAK
ncbi:amino acid ABC transporter permease [Labrys portucalensis]|uniref:Amino acid ABC transporter permease n=1 Tax=Labrys neptuniae TaxID=376174 RepID=A0ABV6ZC91_9HYPH|nr:ABC transporter permease subunit [Labrys neptuniae]MDT3376013.1 ABC transporter permease subunit [Labrys neptuniae]